jgi:hypothetical protein
MSDRKSCVHDNFRATVAVNRVFKDGVETDKMPHAFHADVSVVCVDCGVPFEFVGEYACGLLWDRACVSPSKQELRVPIQPKGLALLPGIHGFTVRAN